MRNKLPIAVIGAGPVGLAAAAHLAARHEPFVLIERGSNVGHSVSQWAHVRVFSPWRFMLWRDSSTRTLGRAIFGVLPVSLLALIYSAGLGGALLFAMLYGVCNGIVTILRSTPAAEFLGRDGFGAINGALTTPAALTRAAGPAIAGVLWLRTENYSLVLWVLFGSAVLSAVAFWWASSDGRRRCPRFGAPRPTGEGVDA